MKFFPLGTHIMIKPFYQLTSAIAISSLLFVSGCSEAQKSEENKIKQQVENAVENITPPQKEAKVEIKQKPQKAASTEITITSIEELNTQFAKFQYSQNNWAKGELAIPRITFSGVNKRWTKSAQNLPVKTKKKVFFQLMTPLALLANEKIIAEREIVKNSSLDDTQLKKLALKYRIVKEESEGLTEQMRQNLLTRVDSLPPSLIVAQAAEESGWATSRFSQEGNAFFGQWDFSGNGMKPKEQRKELGNYGVARFASPLASVEGYMLNINRNNAYKKLRLLRAQLRAENIAVTGIELAGTLDKYSERGQDYIKGLRSIISYNKLQPLDQSYLLDNQLVHLITDK